MTFLRHSSARAHQELDKHIDVGRITSSRSSYRDYLSQFCGAFLVTNQKIDWDLLEHLGLPDLERRQERYLNLIKDVGQLDQKPSSFPAFPSGHSSDAGNSVGTLYVLEGSVHGGLVILRSLKNRVSGLSSDEVSFLEGFGSETGKIWKRFCDWAGQLEFDIPERQRAGRAAAEAFATFESHLLVNH